MLKTTRYFEENVLAKRPEIQREWCSRVLKDPITSIEQLDGRWRFWGAIPERENRILRVVTLSDRETVHNAFFDRKFLRQNPHLSQL